MNGGLLIAIFAAFLLVSSSGRHVRAPQTHGVQRQHHAKLLEELVLNKSQKEAIELLKVIDSSKCRTKFPQRTVTRNGHSFSYTKAEIAEQAIRRVKYPDFIYQGSANWCGFTALLRLLALTHPIRYAHLVRSIYCHRTWHIHTEDDKPRGSGIAREERHARNFPLRIRVDDVSDELSYAAVEDIAYAPSEGELLGGELGDESLPFNHTGEIHETDSHGMAEVDRMLAFALNSAANILLPAGSHFLLGSLFSWQLKKLLQDLFPIECDTVEQFWWPNTKKKNIRFLDKLVAKYDNNEAEITRVLEKAPVILLVDPDRIEAGATYDTRFGSGHWIRLVSVSKTEIHSSQGSGWKYKILYSDTNYKTSPLVERYVEGVLDGKKRKDLHELFKSVFLTSTTRCIPADGDIV